MSGDIRNSSLLPARLRLVGRRGEEKSGRVAITWLKPGVNEKEYITRNKSRTLKIGYYYA